MMMAQGAQQVVAAAEARIMARISAVEDRLGGVEQGLQRLCTLVEGLTAAVQASGAGVAGDTDGAA